MRVTALMIRILRQFIRDKRTMALMIVAPMLVMTLMWLVFNGSEYHPKLGTVDVPDALVAKLEQHGAEITRYSGTEADQALENTKIDAIVSLQGGIPQMKLEGSDPAKSKSVMLLMQTVIGESNPAGPSSHKPTVSYLHGSEKMASFDNFGPVLIGFFIFFFVFLIAGVSFLRERTGGTLERLLSTPLRRWEIVCGYVLGFGIFTVIQSALIAWFTIYVLGIMMEGSFGWVLLITLLAALSALTLGTLLSAFAHNEFQMIQFIPLVVVPQVFFSGLFDMDTMAEWLRWIGRLMPLSYVADALREVMIRGKGWPDIAVDVYVLFGLTVVFMAANVLALRKHRRI